MYIGIHIPNNLSSCLLLILTGISKTYVYVCSKYIHKHIYVKFFFFLLTFKKRSL